MLPPGSFLNNPASTTTALRRAVETDPVLQERLRHALHLTDGAAVIRYVLQLHVEPLAETRILRIFYTRPGGQWGYKIRRVPAGTLVFAGPDNAPRLMQICANPVETMSPARVIRPDRVARYNANESDTGLILQDDTIGQIPFGGNVLAAPQVDDPGEIADVLGGQEETMASAGAFAPPPALEIPGGVGGAGSFPGSLAASNPAIAAAAALASAQPILNRKPVTIIYLPNHGGTPAPPEASPEPPPAVFGATSTLMLLGCLSVGQRRRRRRQRLRHP